MFQMVGITHIRKQRRVTAALLLFVLAMTLSCGRKKGIEPPDFTERSTGVESAIEQTRSRRIALESDLAQFLELKAAFFEIDADFWDGVPRDLFKHSAMACLNEPVGAEAEPNTPQWEAARVMKIGCVVLPLGELRTRTAAGAWSEVVKKMQQIDRLRRLRVRLKREFRRVPEYIALSRVRVAEWRSEVRKIEAEVRRRKPEYGDENHDVAMQRAQAYREKLSEFEREITELDSTIPGSSATLTTQVEKLYRELATL